jgi:large subunit ribosomal protein L1
MAKEEVKDEIKAEVAEKVAEVKDKIEEIHSVAEGVKEAIKEDIEEKVEEIEEKYAKSGKKSKKHIEEVKAEEERQARKVERKAAEAAGEKPKGAKPVTRPRIERRGKKYQEAAKLIEKKPYSLKEALELAIKSNPAKFDASVEIHARLGVDPRQADQNIRTTLVLPNGNGKTVRVAVFAPLDVCKAAKAAGADIAEDEEFLKRLEKGAIDFDILIATPQYMPKLGKYARLLGPKGLMPNPKAGTVTMDVEKAVKESKAGKVEYRVDKQAIVHIGLGKTNFDQKALLENAKVFFDSLKAQKPASIKGSFVKSVFVTTTMGPSIMVENIYN